MVAESRVSKSVHPVGGIVNRVIVVHRIRSLSRVAHVPRGDSDVLKEARVVTSGSEGSDVKTFSERFGSGKRCSFGDDLVEESLLRFVGVLNQS